MRAKSLNCYLIANDCGYELRSITFDIDWRYVFVLCQLGARDHTCYLLFFHVEVVLEHIRSLIVFENSKKGLELFIDCFFVG